MTRRWKTVELRAWGSCMWVSQNLGRVEEVKWYGWYDGVAAADAVWLEHLLSAEAANGVK